MRSVRLVGWGLILFAGAAHAEPPSVASWYSVVPEMPASVQEAASKATVQGSRLRCAAPLLDALRSEIARVEQERSVAQQQSQPPMGVPDMSAYQGKEMQEYQALLQKMQGKSPQEMQAMMPEIEAKAAALQKVTEAAEARRKAEEDAFKQKMDSQPDRPEVDQAVKALEQYKPQDSNHQELRSMLFAQHDELNRKHKQADTACYDAHIALSQTQLARLREQWPVTVAGSRRQAEQLDRILAPAQYGQGANNPAKRKRLLQAHVTALHEVRHLAETGAAICSQIAGWQRSREFAGNAKPPNWVEPCGPAAAAGRSYTAVPQPQPKR